MSGLWKRMKERKLVQWPLAYLAAAWLLVQVCDVLGAQFGWSAGVLRGVTLAFGTGFFLVLIAAWYHGEKGRQKVGAMELSLVALVLAIGGVLLWRFAPVPGDMPMPPTLGPHSVAVLPFENFSADADDAFFADGLADTVLNRLAQLHGLKVIARNSSFTYKGANVDVRKVGRELGVAAVLEGSVQRQGERLRVIAQLVDTVDGSHRWAQTFDSGVSDLFRIQDEISVSVAKALEVELLEGEARTLAAGAKTRDPLALEAVLRGNELTKKHEGALALAQYREALSLDSEYAEAWAGVAYANTGQAFRTTDERTYQRHVAEARHAIDRAIELDPASPRTQDTLAWVLMRESRWHDLMVLVRLRQADAPNDSGVLGYATIAMIQFGQWEEALALAERSIAIDPLGLTHYRRRGLALAYQGRLDEAEAAYEAALARFPDDPLLRSDLSWLASRGQGRWDTAMRQALRGAHSGSAQLTMRIAGDARRLGLRDAAVRWRGANAGGSDSSEELPSAWFIAEGRPGTAADSLQRLMATSPEEIRNMQRSLLAMLCLLAQRPECTREQAAAAREDFVDPVIGQVRLPALRDVAVSAAYLGLVEQRLGDAALGADLLRNALARVNQNPWYGWTSYRMPAKAELLAALGERDAALAELEASLKGDPEAVFLDGLVPGLAIEQSPYFDSIREEPRFTAAMVETARRRQHAAEKVQKLLDDFGPPPVARPDAQSEAAP